MDDPSAASIAERIRSTPPPLAPRSLRRWSLLGVVGLLAWFAGTGGWQIHYFHADFEYFYKAGAWLLAHGNLDQGYDIVGGEMVPRGALAWYWPFVSRLMTLFALLPPRVAGYVWLALNLAATLATIRMLGRWVSGLPPQDWPVTQLLPMLFLLTYWLWEYRLNQIDNFTLLFTVGAFVCWERGRGGVAGFWLGLAVLLKLTPGLLVVWFALKRQYRTVGVAVMTVLLAGPVGDLIALRPALTAEAYRAWLTNAVTLGSHRGLILNQREMDWRNQGLGAVMSRWLHPTNYNTHFDNDPRHQAQFGQTEVRTLNVVALPLSTIATLATGVAVLTLAGAIVLTCRPAAVLTQWQLRLEWALWMLLMLWTMPVMRRYHMIWALPAVSVVAALVHFAGFRTGWSRWALVSLGLLIVPQIRLLPLEVEAAGSVLASVAVLSLPMLGMLIWMAWNPSAIPPPYHAPPHPLRVSRTTSRPGSADAEHG